VNLFIGVFFLPASLSTHELGALDPLARLAGFAAIPVSVIATVGARIVSGYHAAGNMAAMRRFLKIVAGIGTAGSLVFIAVILGAFRPVAIRLGCQEGMGMLLAGVVTMGLVTCWLPLTTMVLQGRQSFGLIASLSVVEPLVKLTMVLIAVPRLGLAGYLAAAAVGGLVAIVWAGREAVRGLREQPEMNSADASEWRSWLLFALPVTVYVAAGNWQGFLEPFLAKHYLSDSDSAAYYMITRLGAVPSYFVFTLTFVLYPMFSQRHYSRQSAQPELWRGLKVGGAACLLVTLGFALFMRPVLGLVESWGSYRDYADLFWLGAAFLSVGALTHMAAMHEIARMRFRFLRIYAAFIVLETVLLYGRFGWGAFRPFVAESIWKAVEMSVPRSLAFHLAAITLVTGALFLFILAEIRWGGPSHQPSAGSAG